MKHHTEPVHRELPYDTHCELPAGSPDEHVCETCEPATTRSLPWGTPRVPINAESAGISVPRSAVVEDGQLAVEYVVSSERSYRVRFRLCDRLPEESTERTGTDRDDPDTVVEATWRTDPNSELAFRRSAPESCRTAVLSTDGNAHELDP